MTPRKTPKSPPRRDIEVTEYETPRPGKPGLREGRSKVVGSPAQAAELLRSWGFTASDLDSPPSRGGHIAEVWEGGSTITASVAQLLLAPPPAAAPPKLYARIAAYQRAGKTVCWVGGGYDTQLAHAAQIDTGRLLIVGSEQLHPAVREVLLAIDPHTVFVKAS